MRRSIQLLENFYQEINESLESYIRKAGKKEERTAVFSDFKTEFGTFHTELSGKLTDILNRFKKGPVAENDSSALESLKKEPVSKIDQLGEKIKAAAQAIEDTNKRLSAPKESVELISKIKEKCEKFSEAFTLVLEVEIEYAEYAVNDRLMKNKLAKQQQDRENASAKRDLERNPLEVVQTAVRAGKLNQLTLDNIKTRVEAFSRRAETPLTDEQKSLSEGLRQQFTANALPVGDDLIDILVRSPLANQYVELLSDARKSGETSSPKITALVEKICQIVVVCMQSENGLGDLYQLGLAEDASTLSYALSKLKATNLIKLKPIVTTAPTAAPSLARPEGITIDVARQITAAQKNMRALLPEAIEDAKAHLMGNKDRLTISAPEVVNQRNIEIEACVKMIHQLVSVLTKYAEIAEYVEVVKHRNPLSLTPNHTNTATKKSGEFAGKLNTFSLSLDAEYKNKNIEVLCLFQRLNTLFNDRHESQCGDVDLVLLQAISGVIVKYEEWLPLANAYQQREAERIDLRNQFNLDIEEANRRLNDYTDRTVAAATRAEEADEKLKSLNETVVVLKKRLKSSDTTASDIMPIAQEKTSYSVLQENPQAITVSFVARLSNRLHDTGEDMSAAINLIEKLSNSKLFNQRIQAEFLAQENTYGILLQLQDFIETANIFVQPADIIELWDSINGCPNFTLLNGLHQKLHLEAKDLIDIIRSYSASWEDATRMLHLMLVDEKMAPVDKDVLKLLVATSKNDPEILQQLFVMYQTIEKYRPYAISQFFRLMPAMVDAVKNASQPLLFVDAVLSGLKSDLALTSVLGRVKEFDEVALSFARAYKQWAERDDNERGTFEHFCEDTLRGAADVEYDGAKQINMQPQRAKKKAGAKDLTDLQINKHRDPIVEAGVNYADLQDKTKSMVSQTNLLPEQLFFVELMTRFYSEGKTLLASGDGRAMMTVDNTLIDGATYLVVQQLGMIAKQVNSKQITLDQAVESTEKMRDTFDPSGVVVRGNVALFRHLPHMMGDDLGRAPAPAPVSLTVNIS